VIVSAIRQKLDEPEARQPLNVTGDLRVESQTLVPFMNIAIPTSFHLILTFISFVWLYQRTLYAMSRKISCFLQDCRCEDRLSLARPLFKKSPRWVRKSQPPNGRKRPTYGATTAIAPLMTRLPFSSIRRTSISSVNYVLASLLRQVEW